MLRGEESGLGVGRIHVLGVLNKEPSRTLRKSRKSKIYFKRVVRVSKKN